MSGDRSYDGDLLTALRRGDQADRLLAGLLAPLRAPEAAPSPTVALATLLAGGELPPVAAAHPVVELGRGGSATGGGPATASRPRRTALRRAIGAAFAAAVLGLAAVLASMPSGDDVVVTPIDESPASSQAPRVDDGHEGRGHLGDHTTSQRTARSHGAGRGTVQTVQPGAAAPTTSGHGGPVPQSQPSADRRGGRTAGVRSARPTGRGGADDATITGTDAEEASPTPPAGDDSAHDGSDDGGGRSSDGGSDGDDTEPVPPDGGDAAASDG